MREFTIAKACFSCKYRVNRIGHDVKCRLDDNYYWMNLVCDNYKPSDNNRFLAYAERMLPKNMGVSKWLVSFLKKNRIVRTQ